MKKRSLKVLTRSVLLFATVSASISANADTWTFYNEVWASKTVADGTVHQYDANGQAVEEGGLTFYFEAGGLKNQKVSDKLGMWFLSNYTASPKMNYMKVSVPAKTKVTLVANAWGNRGIDLVLGSTSYKVRTDTFTLTNSATKAQDLEIRGVLTVKDNVSQVALFKLAIGDELEDDGGPLQLDTTRVHTFRNYGVSGPGHAVEGDGKGGWKSGPMNYTLYKGPSKYMLPIYKTDGWTERESSDNGINSGMVPPILPAWDVHVRDAVVTLGGDGYYYMTGSSGHNIWCYADGIELWRSEDLHDWEYMGLVWNIDEEADPWVKKFRSYNGYAVRAVWAPEIHYLPKHNNYYICFSMCPSGCGLLKSATGRPEGPYVNVWNTPNKQVFSGIDPTIFEDEDGTAYMSYGSAYRVFKMNDDLSAVVEEFTVSLEDPDTDPLHHADKCSRNNYTDFCHEGAVLFKANGKYYLGGADSYGYRYSSCIAIADNIRGPYRLRHEPAPCDGGTNFFQDKDGNWWSSYFGNDSQSHFREKFGLIKLAFAADGRMYPALDQPFVPETKKASWETKWNSVWKNKYEDTSGIDLTPSRSPKAEGSIYNLQGQRLSGVPGSGLYIKNGKKHMVGK